MRNCSAVGRSHFALRRDDFFLRWNGFAVRCYDFFPRRNLFALRRSDFSLVVSDLAVGGIDFLCRAV